MKTNYIAENNIFVVSPTGKISTAEAAEFREAFEKMPPHVEQVFVDMENVDYISSSCLRVLLIVRKKFENDDALQVINCNDSVWKIISATGFDTILKVSKKESTFDFDTTSFKDLITYRASASPDDIFITYKSRNYTWKEIDMYSQIVAHDLSLQGINELSHVGVIGSNSINYVITFFALQKLGAIAVLINDKLTLEELKELCDIGDVTSLCVGNYSLSECDGISQLSSIAGISFIYDISDEIDFSIRKDEYEGVSVLHNLAVLSDNPALMIFSSGSTGRPKAVLLSASNLLGNNIPQINRWNIRTSDSLCLAIPLYHIFAFKTGLCYSMIKNNRVCITADTHSKTIIDTIQKESCTLFYAVPTMTLAITRSSSFSADMLSSLRIIITAGAPLSRSQMKEIMAALPCAHIINLFGLSEINPLSATYYGDSEEHICTSVGVVSDGVEAKIINPEDGSECEPFEVGEILARAEYSFLCYYKLPAKSQVIDTEGFVHTGDLGFFDDDNYLHITGRIKDIIIRGGENILPGEIVDAITEYNIIKEAVVFGVPDDFYGERVVACISLRDNAIWNENEMKEFLSSRLAAFKIPSQFIIYDELPKLANGKYDKERMKKEYKEKE